jgi:hypothetical protein
LGAQIAAAMAAAIHSAGRRSISRGPLIRIAPARAATNSTGRFLASSPTPTTGPRASSSRSSRVRTQRASSTAIAVQHRMSYGVVLSR